MDSSSRIGKWKDGWDVGKTNFHKSNVHETLLKYYGKVTDGGKGLRFFVPLCGKTLDMKWLSDHGQHVVGVEGVEIACRQFFEEQDLKYSTADIPGIPNGKLFTGESGNIQIYFCDILAVNSEILGKFDVVWDRGSLVALDSLDRAGYIKVLQDVTKPGSRFLCETMQFDWDERINKSAPHPLFRKDIDPLFASWCNISEEERANMIDWNPVFRKWGLSWMTNVVLLSIIK